MDNIKAGLKSTEMWVTVLVLVPWLANQFGLPVGDWFPSDPDAMAVLVETTRGDMIEVGKEVSNAPAWVAALYVAGRTLVKLFVK